jgi:hypothetical protein
MTDTPASVVALGLAIHETMGQLTPRNHVTDIAGSDVAISQQGFDSNQQLHK